MWKQKARSPAEGRERAAEKVSATARSHLHSSVLGDVKKLEKSVAGVRVSLSDQPSQVEPPIGLQIFKPKDPFTLPTIRTFEEPDKPTSVVALYFYDGHFGITAPHADFCTP